MGRNYGSPGCPHPGAGLTPAKNGAFSPDYGDVGKWEGDRYHRDLDQKGTYRVSWEKERIELHLGQHFALLSMGVFITK